MHTIDKGLCACVLEERFKMQCLEEQRWTWQTCHATRQLLSLRDWNVTVDHTSRCQSFDKHMQSRAQTVHHVFLYFLNNAKGGKKNPPNVLVVSSFKNMEWMITWVPVWNKRGGGHEREIEQRNQEEEEEGRDELSCLILQVLCAKHSLMPFFFFFILLRLNWLESAWHAKLVTLTGTCCSKGWTSVTAKLYPGKLWSLQHA